jgi:hypothetical protein
MYIGKVVDKKRLRYFFHFLLWPFKTNRKSYLYCEAQGVQVKYSIDCRVSLSLTFLP